ncbi:hypothetical protein ECV0102_33360 [Enterobacter cloacae]|nr:hypothetical protein ECV0102_33360 [Enterobacter cloacae]
MRARFNEKLFGEAVKSGPNGQNLHCSNKNQKQKRLFLSFRARIKENEVK